MADNLRYAIVQDNTIINVVICDNPNFATQQRWLHIEELDPMPWIGWVLKDNQWQPPEPEPEPEP